MTEHGSLCYKPLYNNLPTFVPNIYDYKFQCRKVTIEVYNMIGNWNVFRNAMYDMNQNSSFIIINDYLTWLQTCFNNQVFTYESLVQTKNIHDNPSYCS